MVGVNVWQSFDEHILELVDESRKASSFIRISAPVINAGV
jgi:hypothetical protein